MDKLWSDAFGKPTGAINFEDDADEFVKPIQTARLQKTDFVFDRYIANRIKENTRNRQNKKAK